MRVRKRKGKPIAVLIAFVITFVICTVLMFVFPKKTIFYNNRTTNGKNQYKSKEVR